MLKHISTHNLNYNINVIRNSFKKSINIYIVNGEDLGFKKENEIIYFISLLTMYILKQNKHYKNVFNIFAEKIYSFNDLSFETTIRNYFNKKVEEDLKLEDPENFKLNIIEKEIEENDFFILIGLKLHDRLTQYKLYEKLFPKAKNYILKNSGNLEDAKDFVQDSIIKLYDKLKEERFYLITNVLNYSFGILRNLWLKELEKRKKFNLVEVNKTLISKSDESFQFEEEDCESKILHDSLQKLDEGKRKFIIYYDLENHNIKDTAINFNLDEKSVRVKAVRCRKYLHNQMIQHLQFEDCFNEK